MRTSLASGVALSVPTFFSGLIRAHGGGGGGGGETTTDPWGTTECTDQTTYDTTWATTQETTLPETTVVTTAEKRYEWKIYGIKLYVTLIDGFHALTPNKEEALSFYKGQSPPLVLYPEIMTYPEGNQQNAAVDPPYVICPQGPHFIMEEQSHKLAETSAPEKDNNPRVDDSENGAPAVNPGTEDCPTTPNNEIHFYTFSVKYLWKYEDEE